MAKNSKRGERLADVQRPRLDIELRDADPSTYLAETRRPVLDGDRRRFVVDGYARGLSLEALMRGTNYTPAQLFDILGLDKVARHGEFERLTEVRKEMTLEAPERRRR